MNTRYSFGGDEHILVECGQEMSLQAFFKSLSITTKIREAKIDGVTEICSANASFQIKFDPDVIHPESLLARIKEIEKEAEETEPKISTRVVEIPVFYQDPWTHETLMRFRERHQDPESTDIAYAAEINGFSSIDEFIAAHSGAPWFVSMVGFVSGLPFMYQMVERAKQIQVPKYLSPRTDTPKLTVGYGGCFSCIYSVRGAGGYQMFGITPMPIFDPDQKVSYLKDFMVFFKPGDIVKFKPINQQQYDECLEAIERDEFEPKIREVTFDLNDFKNDISAYNQKIEGLLNGN